METLNNYNFDSIFFMFKSYYVVWKQQDCEKEKRKKSNV